MLKSIMCSEAAKSLLLLILIGSGIIYGGLYAAKVCEVVIFDELCVLSVCVCSSLLIARFLWNKMNIEKTDSKEEG